MTISFAQPPGMVREVHLDAVLRSGRLGSYASSTNRQLLEEEVINRALIQQPMAAVGHYADPDVQIFQVGDLLFCVDPRLLKPRLLIVPRKGSPISFRPHAARLTSNLSALLPSGEAILDWAIAAVTPEGYERNHQHMPADEFLARYGLQITDERTERAEGRLCPRAMKLRNEIHGMFERYPLQRVPVVTQPMHRD